MYNLFPEEATSGRFAMSEIPDGEGCEYRCQFCGKSAPTKDWDEGGQKCPHCGRLYDAILAQDEEE